MLFISAVLIVFVSASWAQECPSLKACIETKTAECGEGNPEAGETGSADWKEKFQVMGCIKTKLTESGFDFEQFKSDSQFGEQPDENKCHPGKIFEACGIETPKDGHRGRKRERGNKGFDGQGPSDGSAGGRQGRWGKFGGARDNQTDGHKSGGWKQGATGQGSNNGSSRGSPGRWGKFGGARDNQTDGQGGRGHFGGHKEGHKGHFNFLKGCMSEFGDDSRNTPTVGPKCRMHALFQCLKDNRAEIEAAVDCTLPEKKEEEDQTCNPEVALAIQACKANPDGN